MGERRGGRQRGTPNRRTVLAERILAIASRHPGLSADQFIAILVKDQELPADIRTAIAREFLAASKRFVRVRAARSSADKQRRAKSGGPRPSSAADLATLDFHFAVAQDATVELNQRRKAALEIAQHFLPKKTGIRRWWKNAIADEYGFTISPQLATEYRDTKRELGRLVRSGANSPATAKKAARLQQCLKGILQRLQCPCPSRYGMDQLVEDGHRLVYFSHQRDNKIILSDKENAEEAHRRARMDCFNAGPESAARHRLAIFKDKKRRFGNSTGSCLTWKEQVDLRLLELLYPQRKPSISGPDDELYYHPFRIEPLAADGNLYPRNSELSGLQ
jgi:hypothetical protein